MSLVLKVRKLKTDEQFATIYVIVIYIIQLLRSQPRFKLLFYLWPQFINNERLTFQSFFFYHVGCIANLMSDYEIRLNSSYDCVFSSGYQNPPDQKLKR